MSSTMTDAERYDATKRVYARLFACMEGYRWTLEPFRKGMDPKDIEQIEAEVRERIRKKRLKWRMQGDMETYERNKTR